MGAEPAEDAGSSPSVATGPLALLRQTCHIAARFQVCEIPSTCYSRASFEESGLQLSRCSEAISSAVTTMFDIARPIAQQCLREQHISQRL